MKIPVLIEPIEGGRFRARAGAPFALCADGGNEQEATELLARQLQDSLRSGAHISVIDLGNGSPAVVQTRIHFDPLPEEDWFFKTMHEAIAANRKADEAG